MSLQINERTSNRVVLPEGDGLRGRIRLMGWQPGSDVVEGSSADYPVAVIKRDFPEAFPIGTRVRANHDGFCEAGGDIRRVMAKTTSIPVPESDGMYADAIFAEEWSPWVKQFADVVGMSISAGAEPQMEAATDEAGDPVLDHNGKPVLVPKLSERGAQIVKRFLTQEESPYNSVDVVEAPGADGRIVSLALESAQGRFAEMDPSKPGGKAIIREFAKFTAGTIKPAEKDSSADPSRNIKKENTMDEETIARVVAEAVNAAIPAAVAEALKPAEPAPVETKGEDVAEAAFKAGLSEGGRKAVYSRVAGGESVESAVEAEQARETEIEERIKAQLETKREARGYTSGFDAKKVPAVEGRSSVIEMDQADFDAMIGA